MKRHIPSGSVDPDSVNVADLPLHRLAGKCQLNELGDKHKALIMQHHSSLGLKEKDEDLAVTEIRTKLERLSCSINVICPVTAFIGVDPVKKGMYLMLSIVVTEILRVKLIVMMTFVRIVLQLCI